jgi:thymidine phosphorylase
MQVGLLALELGAGRVRVDDAVDPKAGIVLAKKIGDRVAVNDLLARISTDREKAARDAAHELRSCLTISPSPVDQRQFIYAYVSKDGVTPWTTPPTY